MGPKTVEQLLNGKVDILAGAPGIGPVRAEAAIKEAEKLMTEAAAVAKPKAAASTAKSQEEEEKG